MNEKIMDLIELAMQFEMGRKISSSVEFGSHVNAVTVYIVVEGKTVIRRCCYLDWTNAEERLDFMKMELKGYLDKCLKEAV